MGLLHDRIGDIVDASIQQVYVRLSSLLDGIVDDYAIAPTGGCSDDQEGGTTLESQAENNATMSETDGEEDSRLAEEVGQVGAPDSQADSEAGAGDLGPDTPSSGIGDVGADSVGIQSFEPVADPNPPSVFTPIPISGGSPQDLPGLMVNSDSDLMFDDFSMM